MIQIKKIASNSLFQSLVFGAILTTIFIMVWDAPIKKYIIKIDPFEHKSDYGVHWFVDDFNGDGNSERIRCFNGINSKSMDMVHYDKNGNITEHYHLGTSEWNYQLKPAVFDINGDKTKELLFFTIRNDSIFFNVYSLANFEFIIKDLYFNTFFRKRDNYAYCSTFNVFGDFDKDGKNELFFEFNAGFGLYPRGIFKMEFPSLKITGSPTQHMVIGFSQFKDLNSDGIPEILTRSSSPSNSKTSYNVKYTDTISYVTVLDYNLNLIFDPIPMTNAFSYVSCISPATNDSIFYAAYNNNSNNEEPIKIMLLSKTGNIIKEKSWKNISNPESLHLTIKIINNIPYAIINNVGRFKLTKNLNDLPELLNSKINSIIGYPYCFDFNDDGTDEIILWNTKDEITIYNEKDKDEITFDSPFKLTSGVEIYKVIEKGITKKHIFTSRDGFFFFEYHKNEFYFLLYIIYFLAFVITTGTVYILLYLQKKNIEKKWQIEKQLSELQFNSVKNQMNPHFMFNALNSVAYLISNGQKDEAYDFLTINSRMMQRVMDDAKEVKRTLNDEIQFTKDYLKIQEHRFKERFISRFEISNDVDLKFEVPKMCIHTYVENAVKHGFRNTKTDGLLEIKIFPLESGVKIWVSDNGMGRKEAAKYKDSTQQGLKIMDEFYRLFEKYHNYSIKLKIVDLNIEKDGQTGMRVKLKIRRKES